MTTRRTWDEAPGRLFPPQTWMAGWTLSLQADAAGYGCEPRKRLEVLENYASVEAQIVGPFPQPVDPATLELPRHVLDKFTPLEVGGGPSLGRNLTWEDVTALRRAIDMACHAPNAGVPRGAIGWAGRDVFHGTSGEFAQDILENGVNMGSSGMGYFGEAFYVADDRELARSNYAEFSDDEGPGAVLGMTIREGARILDLRNAEDAQAWDTSGLGARTGQRGFARLARQAKVDGVYDRSVGGLAIYNAQVLEGIRIDQPAPEPEPLEPAF